MGCCVSVPKVEDFLKNAQPPPSQYLLDKVPTSVTMPPWSFFNDSFKYHAPPSGSGNALAAIHFATVMEDIMVDGMEDDTQVDDRGLGKWETLPITAKTGGLKIGSLTMPPHMAFGKPAVLKDHTENVIAYVMTAEKARPMDSNSSTVNVYATQPQFDGQEQSIEDGYLWASVTRKPFSYTVEVRNGSGVNVGAARMYTWNKLKIESTNGEGLLLALPSRADKKMQDVNCATGVDVALQICVQAALQISFDELYKPKEDNDNSDNSDWDTGGGDWD